MEKPTLDGEVMHPSQYIESADLKGKDITVKIADIKMSDIEMQGGKTARKSMYTFEGAKKKWLSNVTNDNTITGLFGPVARDWIGKSITLYPTTCRLGKDPNKACIRVRPTTPTQSTPKPALKQPDTDAIRALAKPDATEFEFDEAVMLSGISPDTVKTSGGSKMLMAIDNEAWQAAIEMVADMMGVE